MWLVDREVVLTRIRNNFVTVCNHTRQHQKLDSLFMLSSTFILVGLNMATDVIGI